MFCRPCLDSLVTSSPKCPICRCLFGRRSIRKVVCTLQDSLSQDATALSDTEMMIWQAIENSIESVDNNEQRKALVRDNPKETAQEVGYSKVTVWEIG